MREGLCCVLLFYFFSMHVRVRMGSHAHEYLCLWGKRTILGAVPQERSTLVWRQRLQFTWSLQSWLVCLANLNLSVSLSFYCLRNFKSLIRVQHGEIDRSKVSHLNIPD